MTNQAKSRPRTLIYDGFGIHETFEILEQCFKNETILCRLPSHTSHKLWLCDVGVFTHLKIACRDQIEMLCRGDINTVGKGHSTSSCSAAAARAFTKRNITAVWVATGLFLFDPNRLATGIGDYLRAIVNAMT